MLKKTISKKCYQGGQPGHQLDFLPQMCYCGIALGGRVVGPLRPAMRGYGGQESPDCTKQRIGAQAPAGNSRFPRRLKPWGTGGELTSLETNRDESLAPLGKL